MSDPRGMTIHKVVIGKFEDGKEFIRLDAGEGFDTTCMFIWDVSDAFKWISQNTFSENCTFIDNREGE